jgi:HEAT repeat protein
MIAVTSEIRAVLVPFLLGTGSVLVGLLGYVLLLHGVRELSFRRRCRLERRYQPLVDALLRMDSAEEAIHGLAPCPAGHRAVLSGLLLAPLRVASGPVVDRVRVATERLGLVTGWMSALSDRRWWVRAGAARALGSVRDPAAFPRLVAMLDDDHEEARAAAVDALGLFGDSRAAGPLVDRLAEQSRYQRARVVEALRALGPSAVESLLGHARAHAADVAMVADLVGLVQGAAAESQLVEWCADARPAVRAAALRALGTIGPSERTYYYALRALRDEAAEVRAMAARAVARSRRQDAAAPLSAALNDEWIVAAHSARGLRDLGAVGRRELERDGLDEKARQLARQMIWEQDRRATPARP